MGKTIVEKVFSSHGGCDARAGDLVVAELDFLMGGDAKTPRAIELFRQMGFRLVMDPGRVALVVDHFVPPHVPLWAGHHQRMREFAQEHGVRLYDAGSGVCHTIVSEEGHFGPGDLAVGGDSHACTYGAMNCVAVAVSSNEIAAVLASGKLWFRVPETIGVTFTGRPPAGTLAKDMLLLLAGRLGAEGANYKALEIWGEGVQALGMDGRFTLCNMATDLGAKTAVMPADEKTLAHVRRAGRGGTPVSSDPDADLFRRVTLEVGDLPPLVAAPPAVDNVLPASECAGLEVHQAFVGTCTNGRLEDIEVAAHILRGKRVAPGVRLYIAPTSRRVLRAAMASGAIEALTEAGAVLLATACGPCAAMNGVGVVGDGERVITTANRNFPGRLGSERAEIYLASPATVAASALTGRLTDPREVWDGRLPGEGESR